jgi:RimJ/RimL family protein N-acetyltransferase
MKIIETDRLILRTWKDEDADALWHINQDSKVTEFLLGSMTMEKVKEFIQVCNESFEAEQFCFFATEVKATSDLIGFIGLNRIKWEAHFTPAIEIAWRLGSQYWNKGYAQEGAKAVLDYGFNKIGLCEIVSFTIPDNARSVRVMEKIGMRRDLQGDFINPQRIGHPVVKPSVLYKKASAS